MAITMIPQIGYHGIQKKAAIVLGRRSEHADGSSQDVAREHAEPSREEDEPEDEVDPTPRRGIELDHVVGCDGVELVLEDPDQTGEGLEDADGDHDDPGEHDPAGCGAARLSLLH